VRKIGRRGDEYGRFEGEKTSEADWKERRQIEEVGRGRDERGRLELEEIHWEDGMEERRMRKIGMRGCK
jgi:hypothetical protein